MFLRKTLGKILCSAASIGGGGGGGGGVATLLKLDRYAGMLLSKNRNVFGCRNSKYL